MSGECLGTVTYDPEQDEVTKTGSRVIASPSAALVIGGAGGVASRNLHPLHLRGGGEESRGGRARVKLPPSPPNPSYLAQQPLRREPEAHRRSPPR